MKYNPSQAALQIARELYGHLGVIQEDRRILNDTARAVFPVVRKVMDIGLIRRVMEWALANSFWPKRIMDTGNPGEGLAKHWDSIYGQYLGWAASERNTKKATETRSLSPGAQRLLDLGEHRISE